MAPDFTGAADFTLVAAFAAGADFTGAGTGLAGVAAAFEDAADFIGAGAGFTLFATTGGAFAAGAGFLAGIGAGFFTRAFADPFLLAGLTALAAGAALADLPDLPMETAALDDPVFFLGADLATEALAPFELDTPSAAPRAAGPGRDSAQVAEKNRNDTS